MDEYVTLPEMAKKLGITYGHIEQLCRKGKRGVSGQRVQLERELHERGWVTTLEAVHRFRRRLNDPRYGVVDHATGTESSDET
jgi:hypothetical protein